MAKRSRGQSVLYFLRCFFNAAIMLGFLAAWLVLVVWRWEASLVLLQYLNVLESIIFIAINVAYYSAALTLFILLFPPIHATSLIRRLVTLFAAAFWLLIEGLSVAFAKVIGDGVGIFTLYYLLTQFNLLSISYTSFQVVFFAAFLLVVTSLLHAAWVFLQNKQMVKLKLYASSLTLMSINLLVWFTPWPKSLAVNPLPYMLTSVAMQPEASSFSKAAASEAQKKELKLGKLSEKYNIVFIVMESTKAAALGTYNADLVRETPFFDQLAEQSLLFENAYALLPFTVKALTALNCGISSYLHYPILESNYGIPTKCLANLLGEQGYQTRFMQSATRYYGNMASLLQQFGVQEFVGAEDLDNKGFRESPAFGYEDGIMLDESARWLESVEQPFFAQYLTLGPHWPYDFYNKEDYIEYVNPADYLHDLGDQYNRYLNAVYAQDQFLQQLIEQYKTAGLYHDTIFVFVADHGQGFGEHRHFQHANNLYQEGIHIPLMIHAPGLVKQGQRIDELVSQTDVPQMLVNLLNGRAALEGIQHEQVFSACWYWQWCIARTDKQHKYIHNFKEAGDELYDLTVDPQESTNIAKQHPELVKVYREQSLAWYYQQLALYGELYRQFDEQFYLQGHPKERFNP